MRTEQQKKALFYSLFVKIKLKMLQTFFIPITLFSKNGFTDNLTINLKLNNSLFYAGLFICSILSVMFKTIGNTKYTTN